MSCDYDHSLDTRGLLCPEPVMMLHKKVREAASGDLILLMATDPSTERDIAKFCQFLGHDLVTWRRIEDEWHYWIRRA